MATLHIRDFPENLHSRIISLAKKRSRSFNEQVTVLLQEALENDELRSAGLEALERIAVRRRSYRPPLDAVDSLKLLREDRDR